MTCFDESPRLSSSVRPKAPGATTRLADVSDAAVGGRAFATTFASAQRPALVVSGVFQRLRGRSTQHVALHHSRCAWR